MNKSTTASLQLCSPRARQAVVKHTPCSATTQNCWASNSAAKMPIMKYLQNIYLSMALRRSLSRIYSIVWTSWYPNSWSNCPNWKCKCSRYTTMRLKTCLVLKNSYWVNLKMTNWSLTVVRTIIWNRAASWKMTLMAINRWREEQVWLLTHQRTVCGLWHRHLRT